MFLVQIITYNSFGKVLRDFAIITEDPLKDIRSIYGLTDYVQCRLQYAIELTPVDLDLKNLEDVYNLKGGIKMLSKLGEGYRLIGTDEDKITDDFSVCTKITCSKINVFCAK